MSIENRGVGGWGVEGVDCNGVCRGWRGYFLRGEYKNKGLYYCSSLRGMMRR
jgi:hypothetical protein